jgi:hypothetical protein
MSNPFFYGNPVPTDQFLGRRQELRRVVGRIASQGQSTAIVGEPRIGKTSLLGYLKAPEVQAKLHGEREGQLLFSYLDAQTLGSEFDQAQFWEYALYPLREQVVAPDRTAPLARAYRTCKENAFGTFALERLLAQMRTDRWRLVLLLDEFDLLLHHKVLNSAEFFGSLRSLASRSRGALALVIASRQPLTVLNSKTQQLNPTGSPYLNFLSEVTLGPLSNKANAALLSRAGGRFTPDDRRFITHVAGGHPYLLQVAASEMWEAHAEGQDDRDLRWQQVGQRVYDEATLTLGDTWRLWSPATRKAFTIVALTDVAKMLKERQFYQLPLTRDRCDFGPELHSLKKQGFVTEDKTVPGGWCVRPQAFLWWLADEMVRTVRDETPFDEWLEKQELRSVLTRGEKQWLLKALGVAGDLLKGGASALIEAAAKGVGTALVGG